MQNEFAWITKCIFLRCKMYLSELQNVYVLIAKLKLSIFRKYPWKQYDFRRMLHWPNHKYLCFRVRKCWRRIRRLNRSCWWAKWRNRSVFFFLINQRYGLEAHSRYHPRDATCCGLEFFIKILVLFQDQYNLYITICHNLLSVWHGM